MRGTRDSVSEKAECTSPAVRTGGGFWMMEMPVELRLNVYSLLLICDKDIIINPLKGNSSSTSNPPPLRKSLVRPSVAILQTCKLINEEATPILYGRNKFINYLSLEPTPSYTLNNTFLLRFLRWSSISQITSLAFLSDANPPHETNNNNNDNNIINNDNGGVFSSGPRLSRPTFYCKGADIVSRFTPLDMRYAPDGPDEYMALSLSNWVSTQVMRVMLTAFQMELEEMMRPTGMFAGVVVAAGSAADAGPTAAVDDSAPQHAGAGISEDV